MVVHWCPYSRAKAWQSNCYYTGERLQQKNQKERDGQRFTSGGCCRAAERSQFSRVLHICRHLAASWDKLGDWSVWRHVSMMGVSGWQPRRSSARLLASSSQWSVVI